MDRFLYISMSGAKETMRAQAANSNNLANANTTGFRSDFEAMVQRQVYGPGVQNTRVYTETDGLGSNFAQGELVATGRSLDVAIKGEGWITAQAPDGSEVFTRAGNLRKDSSGMLMTASGLPVLGNQGFITIPEEQHIEIGSDGTITARPQGSGPQTLTEIDRIKLVNPDHDQIVKGEDGLFRLKSGEPAEADANVNLVTGTLETSNVNSVDALVNMISLSRQFEMQIKMMRTAADNDESVTQLMRT
jgi:flagellar basal-body rod protein FlgF